MPTFCEPFSFSILAKAQACLRFAIHTFAKNVASFLALEKKDPLLADENDVEVAFGAKKSALRYIETDAKLNRGKMIQKPR